MGEAGEARALDPRRGLRHGAAILAAIVAVAVAARIEVPVPGSPVPQSLQTLAVLLVGLALGARGGALALLAYLAAGAVGLPVFADGAAGWRHLVGPTAGYLAGFVAAAAAIGWLARQGRLRRFPAALAATLAGHGLILALGWARLALALGPATAFAQGVAPFLIGGVAKSLAAAATAMLWRPAASATGSRPSPGP